MSSSIAELIKKFEIKNVTVSDAISFIVLSEQEKLKNMSGPDKDALATRICGSFVEKGYSASASILQVSEFSITAKNKTESLYITISPDGESKVDGVKVEGMFDQEELKEIMLSAYTKFMCDDYRMV